MTEELTVEVPLVSTGVAPAVDVHGGTLIHGLEHVRVRALPANLPQSISYPIDGLADFDAAIHVRDLVIPSDVTLVTDADELVAKVERPRVEVQEAPAEEAADVTASLTVAGPSVDAAASGEGESES